MESGGGEEELGRSGSYILVTFRSSAVSLSHICECLLKPRLSIYFLTLTASAYAKPEIRCDSLTLNVYLGRLSMWRHIIIS